jgi:hypothetical protein
MPDDIPRGGCETTERDIARIASGDSIAFEPGTIWPSM